MKPQAFKARDYLFVRGSLAEALIKAASSQSPLSTGRLPFEKCSYFRVPKLAVNGRCISADFKAKLNAKA